MSSLYELQETNNRQKLLIQLLNEAILSPSRKQLLKKQIEAAEDQFIPINNKIQEIQSGLNNMKYDNLNKMREELNQKIQEKTDEIAKLKKNVAEYQDICMGYDQHQEQLQQEKDKLFNDFQNQPKDNSISISQTPQKQFSSLLSSPVKEDPEELQKQITEADAKIEELTAEYDSLKKILEEKQKKYNDLLTAF